MTGGSSSGSGLGPLAGFCPSDADMTVPAGNAYEKVLTAPARSAILVLNGSSRMSVTNAGTARTITENVTGSGKAIVPPGVSCPSGRPDMGLITLDSAEMARFGLPPLGVIGGVLMEQAAPDMTHTPASTQGHLLAGICAALS
jgi:hypothetical protein